jgi:NAD(P)-dependent dehydrogenase (short-subunit alcohol dehydrogenase family)
MRGMSLPTNPRSVVTGAGSGLGRAFCLDLARRGARILAADVDEKGLAETKALLGSAELHTQQCDVSSLADVEALANEADRLWKGVDLLVNNAGVAVGGDVGDVPLDSWKWIVGVNLWGPIHGCHVFVPRLKKQGSGHILNVASMAGLVWAPHLAPYNVTKAGVVALTEGLRSELSGTGVSATVLCPYFFKTRILENSRGEHAMNKVAARLMEESALTADDVARIALDGADHDVLYVLPHFQGRWIWRLKRWMPGFFQKAAAKVVAAQARRAAEGR